MTSNTGQLYPSPSLAGLGEITTLEVVTGELSPGETQQLEIVSPRSYQLYSILTSCPAWVRVYGTAYARSLDGRVNPGAPFPEPGTGFFAEVSTVSSNLTTDFSPPSEVQVEGTSTLLTIRNDSGSTQEVSLELDIITTCYSISPSSPPYNCNTAVDTTGQTDLSNAWEGCDTITKLPNFNLSSATNFESAWENCTRLNFVPPGLFDNCLAVNFTNAFVNCSLSSSSVDNILVSLDEAGQEDGTIDLTGANNSPPSGLGLAAKVNLEGKGWTVNVEEGGVVSFLDIGEEVYSLTSFEDGRIFAGANSGNVFKSTNYGLTFDSGTSVGAGTIYSIAACEGQTVIAGTWADSFPFISTDNGITWTAGPDFNESEIDSIGYAGGGVIYIGTNGYVHKSEDNGVTWLPGFEPVPSGDYYVSIAFPGANEVVVGTYSDGYLAYSSDGGTTWGSTPLAVLDGLTESISGLTTNGTGIVLASTDGDGRVFRSLDSGETWDSGIQLGSASEVYKLTCSETGVFYAGTDYDGRIYRSLDSGATWEEFFDPEIPGAYVYSLTIAGNGTLLAGIDTFIYSIPYSIAPESPTIPVTQVYPTFTGTSGIVKSDPTGITGAEVILNMVSISQVDYDNLAEKDPQTLYIIPN